MKWECEEDTDMEALTKDSATRNIQRYLRRLSYENENIPRPPLDGIFDTATEDSLKAFQRIYSLSPTGRADKATFDALFSAYLAAIEKSDRRQTLDVFPKKPKDHVIELGEESITVSILQLILTELTAVFDTLEFYEATGIYDESTAENVRRFQRLSRLPITGKVDLVTWNRILRDYANTNSAEETDTTIQGRIE